MKGIKQKEIVFEKDVFSVKFIPLQPNYSDTDIFLANLEKVSEATNQMIHEDLRMKNCKKVK